LKDGKKAEIIQAGDCQGAAPGFLRPNWKFGSEYNSTRFDKVLGNMWKNEFFPAFSR
jgi:hypothetical protein